MFTLEVPTGQRTQMLDITDQVRRVVSNSGIRSGAALVFVPHTTAACTINENADPDVVRDILSQMNQTIPFEAGYTHAEGNSAAHIKASLFGASEQIPIEDGQLVLGTWQGIYFCEFDGPRRRRAYVQLLRGIE